MAYAADVLDEEQKKQQQNELGQTAPVAVGGAELLGGGGAGASAGGPAKPSNTGWTNLKTYINANQPQTMEMAGKIGQNVVGTGEAAKQAMSNLTSGYESKLKAESVPSNYQDIISKAGENPQSFVQNPQQMESFKRLREGLFNAPGAFTEQAGYGEAATSAQKASEASQLAQTPAGQQEMIKNLNPNMSAGNLRLNQLLLGGNVGARESVSSAAKPYSDLRKTLEDTAAQEEKARQESIAAVAPAKQAVQEKFINPQTESLKKFEDQVNQRIQASAEDFNKNQVIKNLQNKMLGLPSNLTLQELENFGIKTPIPFGQTWFQVPGQEPSQTITTPIGPGGAELPNARMVMNPLDALIKQEGSTNWMDRFFPGTAYSQGTASRAGVSTPDEIARTLALQQLLGEGVSPFYTNEDLSQAGTYKPASYGQTSVKFI